MGDEIRTKHIGVPMPVDMADRFEALCKKRGQTMAGIVKMLVWAWMEKENSGETPNENNS